MSNTAQTLARLHDMVTQQTMRVEGEELRLPFGTHLEALAFRESLRELVRVLCESKAAVDHGSRAPEQVQDSLGDGRADFESHMRQFGYSLTQSDGDYVDGEVRGAWSTWKASRVALTTPAAKLN